MSEPQPNPPPPKLDYERFGNEVTDSVGKCFLAAVLTFVFIVGGVFLGFLGLFAQSESNASASVGYAIIGVGVLALIGIIGLAIRFTLNPRRRAFATGIWLGLGVSLLFEGVCFSGRLHL